MDEANGRKELTRPRQGRMVAGVCAGLSEYFGGVDANIVRVLFAALAVFTGGGFALVYLAAWAVMPEEGKPESIAAHYLGSVGKKHGG